MRLRTVAVIAASLLLFACTSESGDAMRQGSESTTDSTTGPTSSGATVASGERANLQDCTKLGQGFTGGATVPRQIFGSYGPGKSVEWDVDTGKPTGSAQNVQMATGLPNGTVTILWGEGANAGSNALTVECTTAWDVYRADDPSRLWHAGIIFDEIPGLGSNTYFCHRIEMDVDGDDVTMKMWENYWEYGKDYNCPGTLDDALDGKAESPSPIFYLELPATGIGSAPVPPSEWTTDGTAVGVQIS